MSVIYFCFVNKFVCIVVLDSTYKHDILFIKKKLLYKLLCNGIFCSMLLFSHSVVSYSLQPHGLQHPRLPCLSPSPGTCSNSCESVMPLNHLILCCPLLLLPSIFPSIRIFSSESALCIRRPKYWTLSFSISPSNEYSGLILHIGKA